MKMNQYTGFELGGYDRDVSSDFNFLNIPLLGMHITQFLKKKEHTELLLKMIQI